jgi:Phage Mu protein F like protein
MSKTRGEDVRRALWINRVQRLCLLEADTLDDGMAATDIFLSTQPFPDEVEIEREDEDDNSDPPLPVDLNAFFAHDIHNRQAQGILNRSLQAAKGLTVAARKDLATALKRKDSGAAIIKFIDKYRLQLAKLLTVTQLASLLEGAREVAAKVPTLADFPGAVPPPPSLEPHQVITLVDRLEQLKGDARASAIYKLPTDQQVYVQQVLAAKEALPPIIPPKFTPPSPPPGAPDGIHFSTIDEAVRALAEKNVMTRQRFDALDAAARAKAFTVAGVDAQDTLTKIRDSLSENVRTGADYETWKQKVLDDVDTGTFLSEGHMETVFRTNVQTAFSDGQQTVLNHPMVRQGFPYSTYDSIHDNRRRVNHGRLEKLGIGGTNIYRINDPVFQTFRPPWDYQDRCGWTPLTVRQAAERGIKEAQQWLDIGVEPSPPAFVAMPDFQPPPGFQRAVSFAPLSVQLSMQSIMVFAQKTEEETESSLLYGSSEGAGPGSTGATDTAREPSEDKRTTKIERRARSKMKTTREKRKNQTFKRNRSKKNWSRSISLAAHDVSGEARDKLGEWTAGANQPAANKNTAGTQTPKPVESLHRKQLRKQFAEHLGRAKLTDEQRGKYAQAMVHVLDQMSDTALERVSKHTQFVSFHGSHDDMNNHIVQHFNEFPKLQASIKSGTKVGGLYVRRTGKNKVSGLVLDGDAPSTDPGYNTPASELYSHELMHAVDGPHLEISTSAEWQAAWQNEIVARKKISGYASKNEQEGLAEFGRLLYAAKTETRQKHLGNVHTIYPQCVAVLKKYGVIQ